MMDPPSVGSLIRKLAEDLSHLVRTEVRLVRAEVVGNVKATVTPIVLIAVAAAFFFGALLTLLGALVGWLEPHVGAGWASFIVSAACAAIGIVLLLVARARLAASEIAPARSMRSLKQDVQVIKGSLK